jgi:hypothetical protein
MIENTGMNTGFLEDDTRLATLAQDIYRVLDHTVSDPDVRDFLSDKLKTYRYVRTPDTLHRGKHVRWLRRGDTVLSRGGVLVDVQESGDGWSYVHVLTYARRSMQYRFDDYLTFQKLTDQEMLVLLVKDTL